MRVGGRSPPAFPDRQAGQAGLAERQPQDEVRQEQPGERSNNLTPDVRGGGQVVAVLGASAVTGIIDRLERAGYVRREPDPTDRRRVLVAAEPARIPDLTGVFDELTREMSALMARYDERETAAVVDYLTNTIRVLRSQTARLTGEE
ncbi:hypothetical protein GCM10011608_02600 [Micromonospora sonchi]|uniref:HTH marR-type domain-containing protein n=1 Tax=Micromonospora sonchi TaxID=1763543 RepID=A0A917TFL6_9ACTN|nr:MarR family transcriptional regulator [Micromonospora sonchi]GGM21426.1 hypothetical protein GCM10011608_02600 [Micromonospora sonchi]